MIQINLQSGQKEEVELRNERKNTQNTYLSLLGHEGHVDLLTYSYILCAVELHVVEQVIRAV